MQKYHESQSAGLIHLFAAHDYLGVLRTLLTPAEVSDFLYFRENLAFTYGERLAMVPEQAIVGQYLANEPDAAPHRGFEHFLHKLEQEVESWDVSNIIKLFSERQTTNNPPTDYYPIVAELAKLNRFELGLFKERFKLAMEKARANSFVLPYRFVSPRTGCGFVFIPVEENMTKNRTNGLRNFTQGHKYDQRLQRCIGVSFVADTDGWFNVEWCYLNFPWQQDEAMEAALRTNFPFREVKSAVKPRYKFEE
jgi:hypothetical protein